MEPIKSIISKKSVSTNTKRAEREEEFVTVPNIRSSDEIQSLTLVELLGKSFPESEWVVDRLIPEGLTVLSAQPASFKTWLLLDIAISVASGDALLGTFETRQSGVLIVDEESSPRMLQQRLQLLDSNKELPIHFMIEQDFKLDDKKINKVLRFCRTNNIKLVTLDSLVRIHNSNENDAVQMAEVFAKARRFTKAGISVLITHHNRKGGKTENASQDMRGSSDILAAVDCHLSMKRDRENHRLIVTQTKVRTSEELPPIEIEVIVTDESVKLQYIGTAELGETKRTKTIIAVMNILADSSELNQKDILATLEDRGSKVNAKTLRSILKDLEVKNKLISTPGKGSELLYHLSSDR